ncbi:MAG: protein kinase [Acidobacteria bacterium]|nr:protein kinase [Acidobacteriota bacterium]
MPEIGDKLAQYTIISAIGSGGMGEVFLAEDTKLGRRTALKFLSAEFASDRQHLERFIREARASSSLNHPNICTIYEINDSVDPPFIAMEFVEGETVAKMILRRRRTIGESLDLVIQIADALAEAHANGIIHRDVKPANIIVNTRGRVKILDFGLAKRVFAFNDATVPQFTTHAGVVLGTASYMAPEQARGLEVDHRSDIWSLGVCLYEMLTGTVPFKGETAADTFASVLTRSPLPPSTIVPEISAELDQIVLRTLKRKREERFQSVEEFAAKLQEIRKFDNDTDPHRTNGPNSDEPTEVFATAPTEHNPAPETDEEVARKSNPNNLTATFERIIGREADITTVSKLLLDPETRLVTLTGIGGTGKTTLSRAVAGRVLPKFRDGVFFIELADISRPEVVASTIAQPLGVKEEAGRPILELLKDHLSNKQMLLVIDNFEQIIDAAPQIAELLNAAEYLKVLVTSRELLRLTAEVEYQVPPLNLPETKGKPFEELRENEAIMLFAERASAARPTFAVTRENITDVAAICARLDGLPLAIELAAARAKILSPAAILSKLENRLNLLTGGARDLPERQKTMRGAVMWSYDLLTDDEKQVFGELSIFSGGFRLDAAEFVSGRSEGQLSTELLDILASLIDKSLILRKEMPDGESRFRMLEVVRELALETLAERGRLDEIRRRHAGFFTDLGATAEPLLQSAESAVWLSRLEEEHDNLRAAMDWGLVNEPEMAVRLAVSVRNYWLVHSHLTEGFGWLKAASETGFDPPPTLKFKLLNGLGLAARFRGDYATARKAYEAGLASGEEAGDRQGTALSNRGLGLVAMQQGDHAAARIYFDAGLAISRELEDKYGIAMSLSFLGDLARTEDRYADAKPMFEEAVQLFRILENKTAVSDALNNLGAAEYCLGDTASAAAHFGEALRSARDLSNRITISCSIDGLAAVAAGSNSGLEAARLSGAADRLREMVGYKIEPAEARLRERYRTSLLINISEDELKALAAEGAAWPMEKAVNEALRFAFFSQTVVDRDHATASTATPE